MIRMVFLILMSFWMGSFAKATGSEELTLSGRLLKPDNSPVTGTVSFTVDILDPTVSRCVLHSESFGPLTLSGSDGFFELKIGNGSSASVYSLRQAVDNHLTFSGLSCDTGNTYTPSGSAPRKVRISFNDGGGTQTLDDVDLNYVPLALHSQTVGGFAAGNLVRVEDGGIPGNATALTGAGFTALKDLIAGTSDLYCRVASNGTAVLPNTSSPSAPSPGQIWYDAGNVKYYDGSAVQTLGAAGSGGTVTSVSAGTGLTGGPITTSGSLAVDVGTGAGKIVQLDAAAKLPSVDGSQLTNLKGGSITTGTIAPDRLGSGATVTSFLRGDSTWVTPPVSPWSTTGSDIYYGGGKVGIGTNTPSSLLTVAGDANINDLTVGRGPGDVLTNTAVGKQTLSGTGGANVAVGFQSMVFNTAGMANTALGYSGLYQNTTGAYNTAVGASALGANTAGARNTAVGALAGQNSNASGSGGNTFIGYNSGNSLTVGTRNTIIGYDTGLNITTGNNNTIIGASVQIPTVSATTSNTVILADGTGNPRFYSDSFGNTGLGTTSPGGSLHVYRDSDNATLWVESANSSSYYASATFKQYNTQGTIGFIPSGGGFLAGSVSTVPFLFYTDSSERMRITAGGNVGIGTPTPGYKLDVSGDISASGCLRSSAGVSSGSCASDARLKTDIRSFDLGLEALLGVTPHLFRYNGLGGQVPSSKPELGVIAQEVEKTAPELIVSKNVKLHPGDTHTTEIKQVNYTAFTYVLINAVKELYQRWTDDSQNLRRDLASKASQSDLDLLRAENEALRAKTSLQDAKIESLERRLENLEVAR